jgi:hypothetical protein
MIDAIKVEFTPTEICWYYLKDFPTEKIFENNRLLTLYKVQTGKTKLTHSLPVSAFSEIIKVWFLERGLQLLPSMVFYRGNKTVNTALHVDLAGPITTTSTSLEEVEYCHAGINIELSGKGLMQFWSMPKDKGKFSLTEAKTPFIKWPTEVTPILVDQTSFDKGPCLVRTDIPHSVQGIDFPRLLVSLRFAQKGFTKTASWDDSVDLLQTDLIKRQL